MKVEFKNQLEKTAIRFLNEWDVRHSNYPGELWHYTDAAGINGILQEGQLWLSDAAFLNDRSELSRAVDAAEEVLEEIISDEAKRPLLREYLQSFLSVIKGHREDRQTYGYVNPAFVACFCKDGDSLHL